MQNLPNDRDPSKQMLGAALEQVEASDRISPQLHANEPLSAQICDDLTIMQAASPFSEAEVEDRTVAQTLPTSPQAPPAVELGDRVSLLPQKHREVAQSGSSSHFDRIESKSLTPNPIAQFSLQDDSKHLNTAEVAVIQNRDYTIVQHSDSTIQNLTDRTISQYSDSAIHNLAEQTTHQAMLPSSIELDRTVHQIGSSQSAQPSTLAIVPKNRTHVQFQPSIFRDVLRTPGSFTSRLISNTGQFFHSIWRRIDLKQLQSRWQLGRQLEQPSSSSSNRSTHNLEQHSSERYQKKLQELDLCRLSFAKELARNGKFRHAIAMAEQIPETSHLYKDSQRLIQSWKSF